MEPEDDSDTKSDNIITNQRVQMTRLEQQTISLSKNISAQRYDLKPDVYDESDEQFFFMMFSNALFQIRIFLFIQMFLVMTIFPLPILKTSQKT